jgi:hypothetical protein
MKTMTCISHAAASLLAASTTILLAQPSAVDWFTIDGGGGVSTGGVYTVSGSIGQPDAGTMSGGNYTLAGGFWGVIASVREPGAPLLSVTPAGGSAVLLSWPYPSAGFGLEQSVAVKPANWTTSTNAPVQVGDQWQVMVSPAAGSRFYRLHKP